MKHFNGGVVFDAIQLGEMKVDLLRGVESFKFAYHDSKSKTNFGYCDLPARGLMSKRSRELLNQLVASIEEDAAKALSRDQTTTEEMNDDRDPPGLADATEEPDQI